MDPLLDGMKERLEKAKERLTRAQLSFQAAQAEMQTAAGEYSVWNSAISLVIRDEEKRLAESRENQIPMDLPELQTQEEEHRAEARDISIPVVASVATVNQTEKVRDIIRAHGTGITTGGIWTEVKDHISNRSYLYPILKRLRDRDEVCVRRGKYLFKTKAEAIKAATGMEVHTIQ
jgi:hypothetical protein